MAKWLALLWLSALTLTACSAVADAPDEALRTARSFLEARVRQDASDVYSLLTDKARHAMDRRIVEDYVARETVTYGSVGPPVSRERGWVQVPVRNLTVRRPGYDVLWPEVHLTLHHNGKRWRVAWAEPLLEPALLAYENNSFVEQLDLARRITEADPYHYRGYLEHHFAYRGLNRPREAELWLVQALERATDLQLPDVHDAMARFKLHLGIPADAREHADKALAAAAPHIPQVYSRRWQADTLVILGRALLAAGDRAGAAEAARKATDIDPHNGTLAVFVHQLAASGSGR